MSKLAKPVPRRDATKHEAQEMDKEVMRLVADMKSGWLRLGRLIQKVGDTRAWVALGFANFNAWTEKRFGKSASSAFSALRSVRALSGVPEEKLKVIGERNANALSYLPERTRKSKEWIDKAATLSTKEFKEEVEAAKEKQTGHPREEYRTFAVRVPLRIYEEMLDAEKKMARMLALDIERQPGLKGEVWLAIAAMINTSEEGRLIAEVQGDVNGRAEA